MLRESPTKQSAGGTARSDAPAGDPDFDLLRLGSFFDIFTELTTDGGATWQPAISAPIHEELRCDAPEIPEPTPNFPPLGDFFATPAGVRTTFPSGLVLVDFKLSNFTTSLPPPPPGGQQVHAFAAQASCSVSTNGGLTFTPMSGSGQCIAMVRSLMDDGATRYFDTEMLSLDLHLGTLMIRESPTKASLGRTSIRLASPGDYRLGSFFDIFVEASADGGVIWQPANSGPMRAVLQDTVFLPKPWFLPEPVMAPPQAVFVTLPNTPIDYGAGGGRIQNAAQRQSTLSVPLPSAGGSLLYNFSAFVSLDLSQDGGLSYQRFTAPALLSARATYSGESGGTVTYDTEMLQWDVSGGTLPPIVRIRESPTKASTGKVTKTPIAGGYMIGSFFDIFTELSADGGATWSPTSAPMHVDMIVDPLVIPPVPSSTPFWPPPNDYFFSVQASPLEFAPAHVAVRRMRQVFFSQSSALPALGVEQTQSIDAQMDLEISTDGGASYQIMRVPVAMQVRMQQVLPEGAAVLYDTEMLQMDAVIPVPPGGIMLRESPTLRSQGGTARRQLPPGDPDFDLLRIGSFFDVFVEISLDGGATWNPATSGPVRMELRCNAPESPHASPNLPPPAGEYYSPAPSKARYAPVFILKDLHQIGATLSAPPPPPGGLQIYTFESPTWFRLSSDGGKIFQTVAGTALCSMQVRSMLDAGATRYFDTEMLQMNLTGGPGFMLRESPTKASLGRTSIRLSSLGDYRIGSFFDIFTEVSIDGGLSWQPTNIGPMQSVLRKPVIIVDSDADGLPDDWELAHFGPAGAKPAQDPDGDGRDNRQEYVEGTDPNDASSRFDSGMRRKNNDGVIDFTGLEGRRYAVECSPDLGLLTPWQIICNDVEGVGPVQISLPGAFTFQRRFYRVVVQVPPP
jgi:hypothetical protein